MKWVRLIVVLLFLSLTSGAQNASESTFSSFISPDSISSHQLYAVSGKQTSVSISSSPLTVLIFLSPECPLSKNYVPVLKKLQAEFEGTVQFIGIFPGKAYTNMELRKFRNSYDIKFELYKDPSFAISSLAHATTTPEVVLLSPQGNVLYQGAIDDWMISLGKMRTKPSIHYLRNAIDQSLSGQFVTIKKTKPVGCLINDF